MGWSLEGNVTLQNTKPVMNKLLCWVLWFNLVESNTRILLNVFLEIILMCIFHVYLGVKYFSTCFDMQLNSIFYSPNKIIGEIILKHVNSYIFFNRLFLNHFKHLRLYSTLHPFLYLLHILSMFFYFLFLVKTLTWHCAPVARCKEYFGFTTNQI